MIRILLTMCLLAGSLLAADALRNRTPGSSQVRQGASLPSTCRHSPDADVFYLAGTGLYVCTAANTWTASGSAATPVQPPSATITLVAPRGYAICTNTCTVTVPVPAAGYEFCILNDTNVATAITLSALGSGAMYENSARTAYGTAGTGTLSLSAAAANKVCIVGRDATHYLTVSYNGTVTVN